MVRRLAEHLDSAGDATALPNVAPASAAPAAVDGDSATSWVSKRVAGRGGAVAAWTSTIRHQRDAHAHAGGVDAGRPVNRIEIATVNGTATPRVDQPGRPVAISCPTARRPGCGSPPSAPRKRFPPASIRHHRPGDHPVRRQRLRPPGQSAAHRRGARAPLGSPVAMWDLGSGHPGPRRLWPPATGALRVPAVAGPEGTRQHEPDSDCAGSDFGSADHLGPGRARARYWADLIPPARHHARRRRLDSFDVLGTRVRRRRRRPPAPPGPRRRTGSAPQRADVDPDPARTTGTSAHPKITPSSARQPTPPWSRWTSGTAHRCARCGKPKGRRHFTCSPRVTGSITLSILDWQDVIDRNCARIRSVKLAWPRSWR